ncbi:hypothetical protein [Nostoc sp.]
MSPITYITTWIKVRSPHLPNTCSDHLQTNAIAYFRGVPPSQL